MEGDDGNGFSDLVRMLAQVLALAKGEMKMRNWPGIIVACLVFVPAAAQVPGDPPAAGQRRDFQRPNFQRPDFQRPNFQRPNFQRPIFRVLDTNRDGEVTRDEFAKLGDTIPRLQAENVQELAFARLDVNDDAALDEQEFRAIVSLDRSSSMGGTRRDADHDPIAGPVGRNPLRFIAGRANETSGDSSAPETPAVAPEKKYSADQLAFFRDKIEPAMTTHCYGCHSDVTDQVRGGLRLDSRDALRRGGVSGDVLGDGDVDDSLLIAALRGDGFPLMPPKKPLPRSVIADFETWVSMGSPDPRPADAVPTVAPMPESTIDLDAARAHWAYQPLHRSDDAGIDEQLRVAMMAKGLTPAASADRETLVRRLTLDLIGLPPTPDEVIAFLDDPRDDKVALDSVVDRLLDSKHFGEHWGRHWLDVARFAESSGKEVNLFYPFAWRYRDYVIDAFNDDKPYDEFIRQQIAGDLLLATDPDDRAENIVATGLLAIGPKSHIERDSRQFALDVVDEQIDAISQAILGTTVSCARCHDHKFDPISQKDYYALAGIFASTDTLFGGVRTAQTNRTTGLVELPRDADVPTPEPMSMRERETLTRQLERLVEATRGGGNPAMSIAATVATATTKAKLSHYRDDGTPLNLAMCVREGQPVDLPMLIRGEMDRPSAVVRRGLPQIFTDENSDAILRGSGRLELAQWMTDPNHPLTSRVMANRVWQHLFGVGLVTSPDNFGTTGSPPSHPLLLDHLATSLVDGGWSIKSLIREIVSTEAYRMSSANEATNMAIDPDNVHVWRQNAKRLPAESIRDSILVAAGTFDPVPPVGSPVTRFGDGQTRVLDRPSRPMMGYRGVASGPSLEPKPNTRSVYLPVLRDRIDPMLDAFDFPDASLVTGRRDATTIASQSLYFMNDDAVIKNADAMATRVLDHSDEVGQRIRFAFLCALSRRPTADEIRILESYVRSSGQIDRPEVWSAVCQSLMATAEFRYAR